MWLCFSGCKASLTAGPATPRLVELVITATPGVDSASTASEPALDSAARGPVDALAEALPHVHGLGFSADGRQLVVPAQDGLRVFTQGHWQKPAWPAHDYIGYAPTDEGFYSSGHPASTAGLVDPLGLIKSIDQGQTLIQLGFAGEINFPLVAAGYQNHAVYIYNPRSSAGLEAGIHYSLDESQTWQAGQLQGLPMPPLQIAVHPTEANVVAIATAEGLFLSSDYGHKFELVSDSGPVSATAFNPSGELLFFGYQQLAAYERANRQILTFATPELMTGDLLAYIAVNPTRIDELAIATFGKDIYLSRDGTQSWQPIALAGRLLNLDQ